jgi:hypothetical protein
MSRTTPQPRLFNSISEAEQHIRRLRGEVEYAHRRLVVRPHPKRQHAYAIAIVDRLPAGDLLWGFVPESATRHLEKIR